MTCPGSSAYVYVWKGIKITCPPLHSPSTDKAQTCSSFQNRNSEQWQVSWLLAVQLLSRVQLFETPWPAAHQATLSFTISQSLLIFMSIESVMLCNCLILCCPLLHLPSIFPSIKAYSNELPLHIRWSKYWSFRFSPSNVCWGLISVWTDWFDLLELQETLKSFLQHSVLNISILWYSAFFMVQLSHLYMTIGKIIVLTR